MRDETGIRPALAVLFRVAVGAASLAHPFFTVTPPEQRPNDFSSHGPRMASWITSRSRGRSRGHAGATAVVQLSELIGSEAVKEIENEGTIHLHAVGDTGRPDVHNAHQEGVAEQMAADYMPNAGAKNPALFLHLGDVIRAEQAAAVP